MDPRRRKRALRARRTGDWNGCATIPALFGLAFRRAAFHLAGADLADLEAAKQRDVHALGWPDAPGQLDRVSRILEILAQRPPGERYRLASTERDALLAALGEGALSDGRRMFLLALAVDRAFVAFGEDGEVADSHGLVCPKPATLFEHIENAPPPIGQMTPFAVCRRWFARFWYQGDTSVADAFGQSPTTRRRDLPARTRQALQRACDQSEIRIALVTWRRHEPADLDLERPGPGRFAVRGLTVAPRPGLAAELVALLAERSVHVALLPEIALGATDLHDLSTALRTRAGRFPALVAAGLAHRPAPGGASYVNEAVLLDAGGRELLRHEKLEPFTHQGVGIEDILPRQSATYEFLDTPIGRVVLNICRDVRSDVPLLLNRMLGATMILVPAYSRRLDFALEEARILGARQGATIAAVNPLAASLEDGLFVYAPIKGSVHSTGSKPHVGVAQAELAALVDDGDASLAVVVVRATLEAGPTAKLSTEGSHVV